ncbi:hypothetical protein EcWSU1_02682 [Enterobacter ludwigii]|uniref:Uncharacterized protein n=1 Tax=Enterobacter ludwigii TaxID=299767 RepID=G8LFD2_9ENTR|nr:hypothetical protein EcWSU1_02682 [Enterobacter ludwigii]
MGSIRSKRHQVQRQQWAFALLAKPGFLPHAFIQRAVIVERQPFGGARELNRVRRIRCERIACRDLANLFGTVRQAHQRMTPHQVSHAGRRLETDLGDGVKRQPEITAVDDGFTHGPQTSIAVHQPCECLRLVILKRDLPRRCLRLLKGFQTQRLSTLSRVIKCGGKRGKPRPLRFRHGRTSLPRHHLRALQLALDGLLQQGNGWFSLGLKCQPAFQLSQGTRPVTTEGQKLHKRGAEIGIGRTGFDLSFKTHQRVTQRFTRQVLIERIHSHSLVCRAPGADCRIAQLRAQGVNQDDIERCARGNPGAPDFFHRGDTRLQFCIVAGGLT